MPLPHGRGLASRRRAAIFLAFRLDGLAYRSIGKHRQPTGVKHTIIATGVGLAAITLLSAGLSSRSIQHGQVCFVVAAAVGLGTYFAHRMAPVRSALWSILAVVLIALMGYVWAAVRPAVAGLPPSIPSSHFMRVLPIQYISIGTAAALAMFWYVYVPVFDKGSGDGNADRRPIPEGRR